MKVTCDLLGRPPRRLEGRHVLVAMLAFFGTIFVVNGYFLHSALRTYTGVVANEPYRKGLHYNERIEADARQAALQWGDETSLTADGRALVVIADSVRAPVTGLILSATLSRPATARFDRVLRLTETAPGRYTGEAGALADGGWLVAFEARRHGAAEPVYRGRRRLWLTP